MQGVVLIVLPCLFWECPNPALCLNVSVQDLEMHFQRMLKRRYNLTEVLSIV